MSYSVAIWCWILGARLDCCFDKDVYLDIGAKMDVSLDTR